MNCLKCGTLFSEVDILIINEDKAEPICDSCGMMGEMYLITYDNNEFAVQGMSEGQALKKWENYVRWMELAAENETPVIRKIKYFVPLD